MYKSKLAFPACSHPLSCTNQKHYQSPFLCPLTSSYHWPPSLVDAFSVHFPNSFTSWLKLHYFSYHPSPPLIYFLQPTLALQILFCLSALLFNTHFKSHSLRTVSNSNQRGSSINIASLPMPFLFITSYCNYLLTWLSPPHCCDQQC